MSVRCRNWLDPERKRWADVYTGLRLCKSKKGYKQESQAKTKRYTEPCLSGWWYRLSSLSGLRLIPNEALVKLKVICPGRVSTIKTK